MSRTLTLKPNHYTVLLSSSRSDLDDYLIFTSPSLNSCNCIKGTFWEFLGSCANLNLNDEILIDKIRVVNDKGIEV